MRMLIWLLAIELVDSATEEASPSCLMYSVHVTVGGLLPCCVVETIVFFFLPSGVRVCMMVVKVVAMIGSPFLPVSIVLVVTVRLLFASADCIFKRFTSSACSCGGLSCPSPRRSFRGVLLQRGVVSALVKVGVGACDACSCSLASNVGDACRVRCFGEVFFGE